MAILNRVMTPPRLGALLTIELFVLTQFVDITLYTVAGFDITVQKIASLVVLPLTILLMGKLRLPRAMLVILALLVLTNSLWYLARGDVLNTRLLSADLSTLLAFVGALALYTALSSGSDGIAILGRVWMRWSVITSAMAALQSTGFLPLYNVPAEALYLREAAGGFYRGVGLKADPNFQAFMLAIGAAFAVSQVRRSTARLALLGAILLGLLATFSRMGLVLFVLVIIAGKGMLRRANRRRPAWVSHAAGLSAAVVVLFLALRLLIPERGTLSEYYTQRFGDVIAAARDFSTIARGQYESTSVATSAVSRALLLVAAAHVFLANPWLGIGALRSPDVLYSETGFVNVAHNTYLEIAMTGGVVGLLFLFVFFVPILQVRYHLRRVDGQTPENHRSLSTAGLMYLVFACGFLFLSLNYNSVLYLPVVLGLASVGLVRSELLSEVYAPLRGR